MWSLCKSSLKRLTISSVYRFSKFDCDNCTKKLAVPECKACDRMVNYFQIFSIPQDYKVDAVAIKNMSRDLQKEFHPDKLGDESQFKEKMQKYSSYINQAKATLLNDLQRAVYLMELKGVEVKEDIEVAGGAFMQELFELQQQIEQSNLQQAEAIYRRIQKVVSELQNQLQLFFTSKDLDKCKQFVIRYKYLSRALTNVKQRITDLQEAKTR